MLHVVYETHSTTLDNEARLREWNYGELNGAPMELVAEQRLDRIHQPFPGGQSLSEVVEQTRSLLTDLVRDFDGRSVLLVAHSANRWALAHLLGGIPLEEAASAPLRWQPGWEYRVAAEAWPV